ncbi:MAG: FAD-dependent oxidoreductase [Candidatus Aminicenantales bacterium]
MNVTIVGNGLAGTIAAKTLRELDRQVEIEIYAEEKFLYYPRPNLIDFIAGKISEERIFAFPEQWYQNQRIQVHLSSPVQKIRPESRTIEIDKGQKKKYDTLLLANGASAFLPPFKGAEKAGVFTLRTLDDALRILEYLNTHPKVAVIGGGLLGLEIARAIKARGTEVEVIEFADYLLSRQLDVQGAALLKLQIEKQGIKVRLRTATEEILGPGEVRGLRFKDGSESEAEMAVVAAGVRPNIRLAKEAGLEVDRGIVVNDFLELSQPNIFAAGDGIQHNGQVYGIIPASFDQSRIAAANILGRKTGYAGTTFSNTLKVVGLFVTSVGLVHPEGEGYEEIRLEKQEEGIYKKIVLKDGVLVGAIWMGTKNGVNSVTRAVTQQLNVAKWKDTLLEDRFDFSLL